MASREEILADFQACTGIEDVEVAICQLEASDWVLVDAVNKFMTPGPSDPAPTPAAAASAASAGSNPTAPVVSEAAGGGAQVTPTSESSSTPSSERSSQWERLNNEPPPPPIPPPMGPIQASLASAGVMNAGAAFSGFPGAVSVANDLYSAGPSTSRTRMLDFYITHHDRTHHLKVPDNEDVKMLKTLIQGETGFSPCQQTLRGFKGSSPLPPTDRRRLADLNLPRENFLQLVVPDAEDMEFGNGEKEPHDEQPGDFRLNITDEASNKTYKLNFRPTQTVLNIKLDLSNLTDIPVSKQVWRGWPENVNDQLSLVQLGIPREHNLYINRKDSMPMVVDDDGASASAAAAGGSNSVNLGASSSQSTSGPAASASASSSSPPRRQTSSGSSKEVVVMDSDDDFEDANDDVMDDEDIFSGSAAGASSSSTQRLQPLIPDDYGDESMAGIKFAEEFANRYGRPCPSFFPGSLDDAIRESCMQPAKERKMLAIYLHHDHSVLTNVFCTQALCADSVVAFLNANFVSFGWDLTHASNKQRLLDMVKQHFGSVAAATIRNLGLEKLPLFALVYKLRGTTEIFQIIHGNVTLDELMSQLLSAHDAYASQLSVEVREEEEREARNAVKREQDLAFELAQQADREKEEQKKREEQERLEQERLEEAMRRSEEEAKAKEEKEKEKRRAEISKRLPPEPKEGKIATLRFRVVGGETTESRTITRRFLGSDSLQTVFDFLTVEGLDCPSDFKVLSSWPRRDLTTLEDFSQTLEALKLFPQETLTLEEK